MQGRPKPMRSPSCNTHQYGGCINGLGDFTYSVAATALAAGGSLLALVVEQVLQADKVEGYRCQSQFLSRSEIHTLKVKRGAVVGQANTLGAGARANEAAQEARQETAVDIGGVTCISGLVAA